MAKSYVKDLLGSTEIVLIETRQHWMAAVRFAMRPIIIALIGLGLLFLNSLFSFNDDQFLSFLNDLITWAVVILFLVAIVWIPIDLIRWDSRRYVLTNRRAMRVEGVMRKSSVDSSLEQITDIGMVQSTFGRALGYADLTLYTASDAANEEYAQLLDGLQFKKAVLDAKEAIRVGSPLTELAADFVVKGGMNEASRRADGKLDDETAGAAAAPESDDSAPVAPPPAPVVASQPEPVAPEPVAPEPVVPEPVAPPPAPAPEPVAEPALVVEPEPEPEPVAPEPVVEPEPEPEPVVQPEPEAPASEPEVETAAAEPESTADSAAAKTEDDTPKPQAF